MAQDSGRITTAQALGSLCAEVRGLRRDTDEMKTTLGELSRAHAETRDMVRAHRVGLRIFVWLGATALTAIGAIKGLDWR